MRKFILDGILFFLLLASGYVSLSFLVERKGETTNDFMAAIIDKHNRVKNLHQPKLILAGGSNVAFGIDSRKIQQTLSVPVVNLSLNVGLGLEFVVKELKDVVQAGDVVILSPEYYMGTGQYSLQKFTAGLFEEAGAYYTRSLVLEIESHFEKTRKNLKKIRKKIHTDTAESIYSRSAFNEYGDAVAHLQKKPPAEIMNRSVLEYRKWEGIPILNDFEKWAASKQVQVFFAFPCYAGSEYLINKESIIKLQKDLQENLTMEILNKPEDLVFEDSFFFDTVYHLNKKGRNIRTDKLINSILKNRKARKAVLGLPEPNSF